MSSLPTPIFEECIIHSHSMWHAMHQLVQVHRPVLVKVTSFGVKQQRAKQKEKVAQISDM